MTPEQQREQWLKRILPALGITVLYFALGSGVVTSKFKKAQDEYLMMQSKGINASVLPIKSQEQNRLREQIAQLEAADKKIHQDLAANSHFLERRTSQNNTLDAVSMLFADHHLQVLEEKRNDKAQDELSHALRDTQQWLQELFPDPVADKDQTKPVKKDAKNKNKDADMQVWTMRYIGNYLDTYRALNALANSDIRVLPISLTMQPVKESAGQLAWTLNLWL